MNTTNSIKLYQFPLMKGMNLSPFCLKLEAWMRMAEIEYQIVCDSPVYKAPKGKFPVIEDQGQIIPDSNFAVEYLEKKYSDPLDGHLQASEKATVIAYKMLVEESLYWQLLYSRWMEDHNWQILKAFFFKDMPFPVSFFVTKLLRKNVQKNLKIQGTGRHSREQIYQLGQSNIRALSDFLGDKPYFMGDKVSSLDAIAYGTLANLRLDYLPSPLVDYTKKCENLVSFCDRIKARWFA